LERQKGEDARNDLAVLVLTEPISTSLAAAAVCLPTQPVMTYVGEVATVAGWGAMGNGKDSNVLQSLDVEILDDCGDLLTDQQRYTGSTYFHSHLHFFLFKVDCKCFYLPGLWLDSSVLVGNGGRITVEVKYCLYATVY
jgi:hypothetical protein